jgi:hypothetical protein
MKNLLESLLDDFENLENAQDKEMLNDWCKEHLKGKYKVTILKKSGILRLRGNVIIKGAPDEVLPIKIGLVEGNISIEKCPNLTSLEGLFEEFMTVKGNLSINNCPKLTSIKGCPFVVDGAFSLTGNSSLKSLEGAPEIVHGPTYIMKNGKKFSEDTIKQYIKIPQRIVCSIEREDVIEESMINEALSEPHLLELVAQIKRNNKDLDLKRLLFNWFEIQWDDIDSSNVREYNRLDNEALTTARNVIAARANEVKGILLLRNADGEYTHIISYKKDYLWLAEKIGGYRYYGARWVDSKSSELMYMVERADSFVAIIWDGDWPWKRSKLQADRRNARKGMVLNTPEYYEDIAKENVARYKKIIAQNRANRLASSNAEFGKIDADVEAIVMKTLKLTQQYRNNAKSNNGSNTMNSNWDIYKVEEINRGVYDRQVYMGYDSKRGCSKYSGSHGLLYLYSEFTKCFMRFKADGDTYYEKQMHLYKQQLLTKIEELKFSLGL